MKNIKKSTIIILAAAVLAGAVWLAFRPAAVEAEFVPYVQFMELAQHGYIEQVMLSDGAILRFYKEGVAFETNNPRNPALTEALLMMDIIVTEENGQSAAAAIGNFMSFGMMAVIVFVAFRMMGRAGGKKAMALEVVAADIDQSRMGFDNVAGNDEAKEMVTDVIDFIKNPDKYAKYGARMPRGLIFYGPPGTGKTLMARAIAAEAGVPFYATSGSDFVQMYVGVGAKRIRELFGKARESGRAVVFIDEIDAIGKSRSARAEGGNDEREQTLNALLTEMSGFDIGEGIVVIAATNRLDTLDEALLRPGRFDRQIEIGLPDVAGRQRILEVHSRNKPLAKNIDISDIARQTVYFSGAMLENLMNEAAIVAAKAHISEITQKEIDAAYYTIIAGAQKKDRSRIKERDRRITAYHEAGHALAAKILAPENTVSKITIIPSTKGAAGFCVNIPPDKMYFTKTELEAQVIGLLAGRAAEEMIFGESNVTTGASNDIQRANGIIKDYITKYGMGTTGMAELSDEQCRQEAAIHMNKLYDKAKELLSAHSETLEAITAALLDKESLNEKELDEIMVA